jgi:hypothetical protein
MNVAILGQVETPTNVDVLVATRITQYRQIVGIIATIEARHEDELKDLKETKNKLSGLIMAFLEQTGQTSAKTPVGTATVATRWTSSLSDPDAFMRYVLEHGAFDLLERRANSTAVKEFVKTHEGQLPPGANLTAHKSLSVTPPKKPVETVG